MVLRMRRRAVRLSPSGRSLGGLLRSHKLNHLTECEVGWGSSLTFHQASPRVERILHCVAGLGPSGLSPSGLSYGRVLRSRGSDLGAPRPSTGLQSMQSIDEALNSASDP